MWQYWTALGIVLLIAEVFTPGFILACFGIACLIAAVCAFIGAGIVFQVAVFSIVSIASLALLRPIYKKFVLGTGRNVHTGIMALIGRPGRITETVDNSVRKGRVDIGPENWKAQSENGEILELGEIVVITGIENATLIVRKYEES